MTDQAGAITFARTYDPYGVVTYTAGTAQTEFGFTGEQYSESAQLVYLRARYVNVNDGRFLSRDTWEGQASNPSSFNKWGYVNGNPVNSIDPSGMFSINVPLDMPAWLAVLGAKTAYAKAGPLKFCLAHADDGIASTDTVNDLLVDYICEYGPEHRVFTGYDSLTLQLAKTLTIHQLRKKFYDGMISPGTDTYRFDNKELIIATIDAWKASDQVNFDIVYNLDIPIPITHFMGSFDYRISKYGTNSIQFEVTNRTDLESGTRIPPILGGIDPLNAEQGLSIEEIIRENPLLLGESVFTLIENYPVISILDKKSRDATSLLGGGGTMWQTFKWHERYDECAMQHLWPFYLDYLIIDRTMY
jgi:RHS repeat-associated protein